MSLTQKLLPVLSSTFTRAGKHKIPRFVYHITNQSAYESMLKDGIIKASEGEFVGRGIFMAELTNLFKRWRNNKAWGNKNLMEALIHQASKGHDDIVILRIPTSQLAANRLVVRSQNKLFSFLDFVMDSNAHSPQMLDDAKKYLESLLAQELDENEAALKVFNKFFPEQMKHIAHGVDVKFKNLWTQRKHALEYIYPENIPISSTQKIGELNLANLRHSTEYDPIRPMRSIFTNLLKGTPEAKGAELLTC